MILHGDCVEVMAGMDEASVDAICTDPPYELGFMGKAWDGSGIAYSPDVWREALRVLKPGGHLLAFGGSRTYHRLACAVEDAGFEIRDQIMWVYGSGFPKSLNVGKAIDKAAGAEREVTERRTDGPSSWMLPQKIEHRAAGGTGMGYADGSGKEYDVTTPSTDAAKQWDGWGTALKPAHEPIVLARKPPIGTVAENVQQHGTGALNIDGCRVGTNPGYHYNADRNGTTFHGQQGERIKQTAKKKGAATVQSTQGRWPANFVLSWPEDEYELRDDVTPDQLRQLAGWMDANA